MNKIARIVAIVYIGLLTVFALLSGSSGAGIIANVPNIAPWILAWMVVLIAWKNPREGGWAFLALSAASVLFFHTYQELIPFMIVSAPLAIIGVLFLTKGTSGRKLP